MNTTTDKLVNFIERWALLFLILVCYIYLSLRIILFLAYPPKLVCGMPLLGAVIGQTFICVVAFIVVSVIFYFGKRHNKPVKIIVYSLIFIPPCNCIQPVLIKVCNFI